jgi:hypothetical protein
METSNGYLSNYRVMRISISNIIYYIIITLLTLFLFGCCPANKYVKSQFEPIDDVAMPDIIVNNPISIIPIPNTTEPTSIELAQLGHFVWTSNIDELTDTAVKNLEDILKRRHIIIIPDAKKVIKLSVTDAGIGVSGYAGSKYVASIQVITGDGSKYEFTGFNTGSSTRMETNISQAINDALLKMLKNEVLLAYLKN